MSQGAPAARRRGPHPEGGGEQNMALVPICELGYCPYADLYPLKASDVLTCDDCSHSVYVDEMERKASSGESQPKERLG